MLIGVDTYSYHRSIEPLPGDGAGLTLDDLLPMLAEAGAEVISLSAGLRPYLDGEPLRRLRRTLEELGLHAVLSAGAFTPRGETIERAVAAMRPALEAAAFLGVPAVRVVTGWFREQVTDIPAEIDRAVVALRQLEPEARTRGLRLAVENHADLRATELRRAFDAVGSEWLGLTLDVQNCSKVCDDPFVVAEMFLPRLAITHLRDSRIESILEPGRPNRYGIRVLHCCLGDGVVPLHETLSLLAERRPDVPWIVENINGYGDEHAAVQTDLGWLRARRAELSSDG